MSVRWISYDASVVEMIEGRYSLEHSLGSGGMGEVWSGHDRRLRRPVAVKLMKARQLDGNGIERFVREAQLTAALEHPRVPVIYDAGSLPDQRLFLVMQLIRGRTLERQLADRGPFPVRWAAAVAAQVSEVLAYAHDRKVVHRDLKPGNLMITPTGEIKVLDFGIAAALDVDPGVPRLTAAGATPGTPGFIAPEQLLTGEPATEHSDLYALGCVLYELLAGEPPFVAPTPSALGYRHATAEPRPIRELRPDLPTDFAELIAALMAKSPADRPGSAAEVRSIAEPWAVAVSAAPPPAPRAYGPRPTPRRPGSDTRATAAAETVTADPQTPLPGAAAVAAVEYDPTVLYTRWAEVVPVEVQAVDAVDASVAAPSGLAVRLAEADRLVEAEAWREALGVYAAVADDSKESRSIEVMLSAMWGMALCSARLGGGQAAMTAMTTLLPRQEEHFGPRSPQALATRWELVQLLAGSGQVAQAINSLSVLRDLQRVTLEADDPAHERTRALLERLERLGRYFETG